MSKNLFNNVNVVPTLDTADIATDTTTNGADVNRAPGAAVAQEVLFFIDAGAYTDGTYVIGIEESADDGAGSPAGYTDAAAAAVVGGDAGTNIITVSDSSNQNTQTFIGYVGSLQWVRLTIVSTSTTTGWADIAAYAILGRPDENFR